MVSACAKGARTPAVTRARTGAAAPAAGWASRVIGSGEQALKRGDLRLRASVAEVVGQGAQRGGRALLGIVETPAHPVAALALEARGQDEQLRRGHGGGGLLDGVGRARDQ